jgi:raffinose/stachyose/melibiose transport system permease protein
MGHIPLATANPGIASQCPGSPVTKGGDVTQAPAITETPPTAPPATLAPGPPATARRTRRSRNQPIAYLYIAAPFAVFAVFVLYPLAQTVRYSFTDWDGLSSPHFIGFKNYVDVITDPVVRAGFDHSLIFLIFYAALPITIGLVLAGVMGRAPLRGLTAYRTILFLPQVVSLAVTGIAWRWMYAPDGAVNQMLRVLGLSGLSRAWLGDPNWALIAVGLVGTWVMFGFCMVLFLVGVQRIDHSLYEAVRVDGAGPIREFFVITLPSLRREISIALTLTSIAALRSFDLVFVTTGGGPGNTTDVVGTSIYRNAFSYGAIGRAAAMSVVLALLIFAVVRVISLIARERH